MTLGQLGLIALEEGDLGEARELLVSALASVPVSAPGDSVNLRYTTDCLANLSALAAHERDAVLAGRLWGAVEALESQLGLQLMRDDRALFEQIIAEVRGPDFDAAVATGRTLTPARAVAEALEAYAPHRSPIASVPIGVRRS
jgi:hypothetical protein